MRITEPGIYSMPAEQYHADPCPAPSLSRSVAKLFLSRSPAHVRMAHPRLNPDHEQEQDGKFDIGTAAHDLLLEGLDRVQVIEADDWRTKQAQTLRELARADKKLPLLKRHYDQIQAMLPIAREALAACEDLRPFSLETAAIERSLIWREGDAWLRCRPDAIAEDFSLVLDYKTTGESASPEGWIRNQLTPMGNDLQGAFAFRAIKTLTGREPYIAYLVQEVDPPFACSIIGLGPEYLAFALDRYEHVVRAWQHCMKTGDWPAYPPIVHWAEPPAWEQTRWLERQAQEAIHGPQPARPVDTTLGEQA